MNLTDRLAEFIEKIEFDTMPPEVIHAAKKSLLDFIGCAVYGYQAESSQIVLRYLRNQGGKPEASIVVTGEKMTCAGAALAHGTMACSTELDDVQPRGAGCHAGEFVMPVVLALTERAHQSGKKAIEAIVAGYESTIRFGGAKTAEPFFRGISPPVLSGVVGAAAAAAKLYGLDKKKIADTFGMCFPPIVPLGVFKAGVLAKAVKGGLGSWAGLLAADLAREGMEGLRDNLDNEKDHIGGIFNAIFGKYDEERLVDGLGEKFEILGTGFKAFTACGFTHAPLTGVFEILKTQPVVPEDIEKIRVRTFKYALELSNPEPPTTDAALFSIPYAIACALVNRSVMPDAFTKEEIRDPRKVGIARKVEIIWDPSYDAGWPESHRCRVEIVTKEGKTYQNEVKVKKGHPDLPLSDEELIVKFEKLSAPALGKDKARKIVDRIFTLQEMDDINPLIHLLQR